jgi:hypothetical protein
MSIVHQVKRRGWIIGQKGRERERGLFLLGILALGTSVFLKQKIVG